MTTLQAPSVEFAGFYYPEILRELLTFLRRSRDAIGLTDENEFEVHTQLLRAFSLVGHLNNTRLDVAATELLLPTARLLESVKRLLRLIGVELASASPAAVDLLLKLSEVTSSDQTGFVPELSEFSTDSTPPIGYEYLEEGGLDLNRTDEIDYAYLAEEVDSGTDGVVVTASPDIFESATLALTGSNLGDHFFVTSPTGITANSGEFRVTEVVSPTQARVVKVPGSTSPAFQSETSLVWSLKSFGPDKASELNSGVSDTAMWTGTPAAGDLFYFGHEQVFPSQIDVNVGATVGVGLTGTWEYFDDSHSKFTPTSVTDNGGTITFDLTSLLGTADVSGAIVTVEYTVTGARETLLSTFSSTNQITTNGTLGQITVSEDQEDYLVTASWVPFENQADGTNDGASDFEQDGSVTFKFPQDQYRNWQATEVNAVDAVWFRYRLVSVSTPTAPTLVRVQIDQDEQYVIVVGTQGETIGPQILGSSDGAVSQEFELAETPFIDDTETIEVDEGGGGTWTEYTRVENFLNSTATSRNYTREASAEDKATIRFGDGINGKIPPAGTDNVRATYRVGGDQDGNVGVGEIVVNADGVAGVSEVTNPRSAIGWRMKDGGTDEDLERVKRDAPGALRTRTTASTADDVQRLATTEFTDSAGTKPVARAVAVEEGLGAKTASLLVVGTGGTTLTAEQKEELEEYFNGNRAVRPPIDGVLVLNQQVGVFNYEPKIVQVEATVIWDGGNATVIRAALLSLLTPLSVEDDGTTYTWDFGGSVSLSRVYAEIHSVDPNISDVPTLLLNGVAASVSLGSKELPVTTSGSITISIQQS
jgi:hypothetical protein